MSYLVKAQRLPELPGAGRLGRHVWHDSRSLAYPYRPAFSTLVNASWKRNIPILDQGDLGSCTGNAMTGALGTGPVYDALPADHPVLNEAEAVRLYSAATALDGYPGTYPPDDTGSDGLSVCKAAQAGKLISGYTHALSLNDALAGLCSGPVLFGINWYSSFDEPGPTGLVSIGSGAYVRGGHEVVARGIDTDAQLIHLDNSWGTGWGNAGSFSMSWDTMGRLLSEDGDATVPVPATAPTPQPQPPGPTADANDRTLWAGVHGWANARHYTTATKTVAADLKAWAKAKGLPLS